MRPSPRAQDRHRAAPRPGARGQGRRPASWSAAAAFILILTANAGCTPYRPSPVDPAALVASYNARRLDDVTLLAYLDSSGTRPLAEGWQARDLALAAWYFSPALDVARAARAEAIASQITAGTREQPSLVVDVEHNYSGGSGQPPWGVATTLAFTVELGGKRGARIARAQARTFQAEEALAGTAWETAMAARRAMDRWGATAERVADVRAELADLVALDSLLQERYREGVVSRADLAQNEAELHAAQVERTDAARAEREALVAIASELGVAPERLDTLRLAAPAESWCDQTPAVARDSLQALMTRSRSDVGVAVAGYAVAETDVRVEISKQYPDFSLGPGLFFDHGVNKWTVLFGIPSIPLHRNRGPIAEAEARRAAAAGHLESVQDSALAQVDAGLERCRLSGVALEAADSLAASVELRAARARAAYQRGETSLLELAFLDLARTRAARTHHLAEQQRREAGTRLEEAVGVWLTHPPARWPDVTRSPRPQPQETTQP